MQEYNSTCFLKLSSVKFKDNGKPEIHFKCYILSATLISAILRKANPGAIDNWKGVIYDTK